MLLVLLLLLLLLLTATISVVAKSQFISARVASGREEKRKTNLSLCNTLVTTTIIIIVIVIAIVLCNKKSIFVFFWCRCWNNATAAQCPSRLNPQASSHCNCCSTNFSFFSVFAAVAFVVGRVSVYVFGFSAVVAAAFPLFSFSALCKVLSFTFLAPVEITQVSLKAGDNNSSNNYNNNNNNNVVDIFNPFGHNDLLLPCC